MPPDDLITREEVLAGLYARQGRYLLFLIECQTARSMADARQPTERFPTAVVREEQDLAFLRAFTLGGPLPFKPSIQDIERHAPRWAALVPDNPGLRAEIAHALGRKYTFTARSVPNIRAVLGLDDEGVRQAYERHYQQPLEAIYAKQESAAERLRWAWARFAGWLEALPPFWAIYALTLTETVGASILALPIALAGIGPIPGVILLVILGLVNVLTVAYMAEAASRSGTIRYGNAYIGQMVADYLGRIGSNVLSLGVITICFLALMAFYIGFSTTLADVTRLPAGVWAVLLFAAGMYFISRRTLNMTVAAALLTGMINIGLIVILSAITLVYTRPANLMYINVPFINGVPFTPSILGMIFGVVLAAYFGHLSVSNAAKVVMRRDPSGRSLVWGAMAAQITAIVLYSLWVVAVNGAVAPDALASESGTALVPLTAQIGPVVPVFGTLFVILGMGMGSIHSSLGLFNLVREWLPALSTPELWLPRQRGRLLFRRVGDFRGSPCVTLTYLGLDSRSQQPRFHLEAHTKTGIEHADIVISGQWNIADTFPALTRRNSRLEVEVLDARAGSVHLRVKTGMLVTYEGEWHTLGLRLAAVSELPELQRQVITLVMRGGPVTPGEVTTHTGQNEATVRAILSDLVGQGLLTEYVEEGETHYQVHLASLRRSTLDEGIWEAVTGGSKEDTTPSGLPGEINIASVIQNIFAGSAGRFIVSVLPVLAAFLLAEWSLLTGTGSFTGLLSLAGVIVVSLLAGIFPVLLLVSSRRKGDFLPQVSYRLMGNPVLLAIIYTLSLASIFVHGLFIWDRLPERIAALVVGVGTLIITVGMAARGAFARRIVVALREEGITAQFSVLAGGQPAATEVRLRYPDGEQHIEAATGEVRSLEALQSATFRLPLVRAGEARVWAYRITAEGDSEGLPALVRLRCSGQEMSSEMRVSGGQATLPLRDGPCEIEITMGE